MLSSSLSRFMRCPWGILGQTSSQPRAVPAKWVQAATLHQPPAVSGVWADLCEHESPVQALRSLFSPPLCLLLFASIKHRKFKPFILLFVSPSPRPGSLPCPLQPLLSLLAQHP